MSIAASPSSTPHKPRIALTIGDPAGIGPELVLRLLADPATAARADISLIGNTPALERAAKATGLPLPQAADWLQIVDWAQQDTQYEPAVATEANGKFILESLTLGARMVAEGRADALCFAPLNKGAMRKGGMHEEDEMRWFAKLLDYNGLCGELNILDDLWTGRVTSHMPLKDVSSHLTPQGVAAAIRMLTESFRAAGNPNPRIGVCGFNPHNGDNGNYGREEIDVIEPGIKLAADTGCPSEGPYPADTIFLRAKAGKLDGIVTMYHDQGQIATKLLGFDVGVTVEGGLPIPITTPAHGTAYDIVGQGIAKPTAMANAFELACRMGSTRAASHA
ncbi:4-hydroxythreonine-4-phosphate dehydrogenase PdxA [Herbaspirillum chlorophenolicum]|uniref:4-hydroxythreonine-4-phosphate dehydrogenase PdxA n=1 Tax=Herbaspirillum chlorophenolicum TaxID=211589 RepID=UPI00067AD5D3|nr:4-hydroxythreonine-4-phosphate dehydrogenase PdxA [Herbaspirillum chlorophenolicum]